MKLWRWWVVVVLVVSGPWFGLLRQPQWQNVHWMPFSDPADKPLDVLDNLLLFLPFGWSSAADKQRLSKAASLALAMSVLAESTQLFSRFRYPSGTDVLMGVAGTVVGFGGRLLWDRRPSS
ncbi:MAG TPA: VanZ family protein [Vicinamibacterales bacterium]|nr:VanZ family protein [Vicinamibacterales bacterium]